MWMGGFLTFWIGPGFPAPAPPILLERLEQVAVTHNDTGRSGFQLTFSVGRDRGQGLLDYGALAVPLVRAGSRVILVATLGGAPVVIMDGLITNQQLAPGAQPGSSKLTVTGEDVSVAMDLTEQVLQCPGMSDALIAMKILAGYGQYGVLPKVIPHPGDNPKLTTDQNPTRTGTDLGILNQMAETWGYVFHVEAGPAPGTNTAYWGPPSRAGVPQRALTFNIGSASNLSSIQFQSDANKPKQVRGVIQEANSNSQIPVFGLPVGQPLALMPALFANQPFVGTKRLDDDHGGDVARAFAQAASEVEQSTRDASTASGELDVGRYGGLLKARGLVDVRGVGFTYDGTWYVKSVSHTITRGSYKQSFNLEREGTGPLSPVVRA